MYELLFQTQKVFLYCLILSNIAKIIVLCFRTFDWTSHKFCSANPTNPRRPRSWWYSLIHFVRVYLEKLEILIIEMIYFYLFSILRLIAIVIVQYSKTCVQRPPLQLKKSGWRSKGCCCSEVVVNTGLNVYLGKLI